MAARDRSATGAAPAPLRWLLILALIGGACSESRTTESGQSATEASAQAAALSQRLQELIAREVGENDPAETQRAAFKRIWAELALEDRGRLAQLLNSSISQRYNAAVILSINGPQALTASIRDLLARRPTVRFDPGLCGWALFAGCESFAELLELARSLLDSDADRATMVGHVLLTFATLRAIPPDAWSFSLESETVRVPASEWAEVVLGTGPPDLTEVIRESWIECIERELAQRQIGALELRVKGEIGWLTRMIIKFGHAGDLAGARSLTEARRILDKLPEVTFEHLKALHDITRMAVH